MDLTQAQLLYLVYRDPMPEIGKGFTMGEVIDFFGSKTLISKVVGVSKAAVDHWKDEIPELRKHQLACIFYTLHRLRELPYAEVLKDKEFIELAAQIGRRNKKEVQL